MPNRSDPGGSSQPEDLALYAMQLLSGKAAPITQHIAHCAECRRELAHIQGDLAVSTFTVESSRLPPSSASAC